MRKRNRVLILAALVAAFIVPVGYALSIDSMPNARVARYTPNVPAAAAVVAAPIVLTHVPGGAPTPFYPVSDSAKLLCIGTALVGLAAAVRKSI
jgi:hypothetical protein